jgi:hypothetical protein
MVKMQKTVWVLHHSPILFCSGLVWFYYVRLCQIKFISVSTTFCTYILFVNSIYRDMFWPLGQSGGSVQKQTQ